MIGMNLLAGLTGSVIVSLATKLIKSKVDEFRAKVAPVEGSVVYCDLYFGAEHSGIYIGNGKISNIVVTDTAEATVKLDSRSSFVDSSKLHGKIYVSCNRYGAVGNDAVANEASDRVGERSFYGLVIKNCHQFSENCVNSTPKVSQSLIDRFESFFEIEDTWEPTIRSLKEASRQHLGATKWRLWEQPQSESPSQVKPLLELNKLLEQLSNTPLDSTIQKELLGSMNDLTVYKQEISDESLPQQAHNKINQYAQQLKDISNAYEKSKHLSQQTGYNFTYNELKNTQDIDFTALANELTHNKKIQSILNTLGRSYISEEKKEVPIKRSNANEIFGIHKSGDVTRVLPSELAGFENEELELLFYAKLLESNLSTYKMSGHHIDMEEDIESKQEKGPIIACLDTSASMDGSPILKARALLFAIHSILNKEQRELYVLLFGDNNEIKELHLKSSESKGLLAFLTKSFNGGTSFETPLKRSVEIIENAKNFDKADILMITDGACDISSGFKKSLTSKKQKLGFSIQTVICDTSFSSYINDDFSDNVISI
ncbi:hypothetical protein HWV00_11015 [Moritella sp. 24]|uniref:VWA domain-containing protein n=1 Tax=Moritella sp. 24 TaxID=2746230 RepID=UPI001BA9C10B|nr:VWA domain-containing protein [Moritella sp. 24]QUM76718.1 hypothetical protein HWV00_11015 [Moritella sp. 24]